jgi:potassium/sodium efflux P-type ATPase
MVIVSERGELSVYDWSGIASNPAKMIVMQDKSAFQPKGDCTVRHEKLASDTGLQVDRVRPPHALTPEDALIRFQASFSGLSQKEAESRAAHYGANVLPRGKSPGPLKLFWHQINSPLIWVLLGSGAVSIAADPEDGLKSGMVIFGVVLLNTVIGFLQEFRASKAIEALSQMVPENTNVLRNNTLVNLPAQQLVPGDIVSLVSGDKVPADMRLLSTKSLRVEEAALTGESVPTEKSTAAVDAAAAIGDREGMVFGGTLVTYGSGQGVVVSTGAQTELGKINELMHTASSMETPLTRSLMVISKWLTIAISALALVILAIGTLRMSIELTIPVTEAFRETLIFSIALAVGAIPEGLPAIVTIALAIGVQRMAKRKAVVRKLPSVETLGSTTVICSDKTGTLTKNEMTVTHMLTAGFQIYHVSGVGYDHHGSITSSDGSQIDPEHPELQSLLHAGILCNDASISRLKDGSESLNLSGDPTELALLVAGEKLGISPQKLIENCPRVDSIPFESDNQLMATVHRADQGFRILLKGAPEVILSRCDDMTEPHHQNTSHIVNQFASQGLRVLAFAQRFDATCPQNISVDDISEGFSFLGLQAMIDPPRQEAIESIKKCHQAGISVKMITGDHPETAEAIGKQLGILHESQKAIKGVTLAQMSDEEIRSVVTQTNVFARVAPEHKLRLVKALQEKGHIAAMTGDGVNDAPALKQANIGIAMGITGTSVSKEAADIVLMDDNFATIAAAVEEGRRVHDNLIKSLAFVLPTNLGLALILVYAVLFFPFTGSELLVPILPTQILWINLVGAIALALPLAFEAKERDVMSRPPRRSSEPILSRFVMFRTVVVAILMTMGAVALFHSEFDSALAKGVQAGSALTNAQTMAVTTVVFFQLFYMLNCRSLKESIFAIGLTSNQAVFWGVGTIGILQAAFIYFKPLQILFSTAALPLEDILLSAAVGAIIIPVVTFEKFIRMRITARGASAA